MYCIYHFDGAYEYERQELEFTGIDFDYSKTDIYFRILLLSVFIIQIPDLTGYNTIVLGGISRIRENISLACF